ncbi:hypothetical protein RvY_04445 [Ramazzottius varieornatus]|uniref:Uncharacterized protein n=1 Tax=Ramazzottius varieornatus TaxID=947166 RepID=A0A1D1UXC6_RAMVA|nr:hypothetical protein RvY_04445 [Ramazzottius varieornatus]
MSVKPEEAGIEEVANGMGLQTVGGCGCNPVPTEFSGGDVGWTILKSLSGNFTSTLKKT